MEEFKSSLRKSLLKKRRALSKEEVNERSGIIISKLMDLDVFKKSKTIMLYLSFKNEVDTYELIEWCFKNNKSVVAPYNIINERKMIPCEIKNLNDNIQKSSLGVFEPNIDVVNEVNLNSIDLIIVPGVAFDKNKNRLGFGGGYYDRFLSRRIKSIPTVAICYDFQLLDEVPVGNFDIPMDMIITENNIL